MSEVLEIMMTVKVVSSKTVKTKKIICYNCGYELEYTGEDITTSCDSDGDIFRRFITCPRLTCKVQNKVPQF